jgi:4-amino-4-deoxy-L-arabinose transferase-like glycosyltransferase
VHEIVSGDNKPTGATRQCSVPLSGGPQNTVSFYWVKRVPGPLLIVLLWAVLFIPNAGFRSLYQEEGRRALLARDILTHNRWLQPRVLGEPYLNKPPLQPQMMALAAKITGRLDEWSVRWPSLVATLLTALLVFSFTAMHTRKTGALYAAAAFLVSPLVIEKARLGETDMTVTAMSMAALIIWWRGFSTGRLTRTRWILCGLCLSLLALTKGPPPLPFFVFTVLIFTVMKGRYKDLAGLGLSLTMALLSVGAWSWTMYEPGHGQHWAREMHLTLGTRGLWTYLGTQAPAIVESVLSLLPWLLVGLPVLIPARGQRMNISVDLSRVLLLYTAGFTLLLLFWPGMRPRYLMPVVPALAVAAGIVSDRFWARRRMKRVFVLVAAAGIAFQFGFNFVFMPTRTAYYTWSRTAGLAIGKILKDVPEPIYSIDIADCNFLFYAELPAKIVTPTIAATRNEPIWLIIREDRWGEMPEALRERGSVRFKVKGKKDRFYYIVKVSAALQNKGLSA